MTVFAAKDLCSADREMKQAMARARQAAEQAEKARKLRAELEAQRTTH